jgi:hypothetical protein
MSATKTNELFCWICLLVFYDQKAFDKHGCDRQKPLGLGNSDSEDEENGSVKKGKEFFLDVNYPAR